MPKIRKATILFTDGTRWEFDSVWLEEGGVCHYDADGVLRWHPSHKIEMVLFK